MSVNSQFRVKRNKYNSSYSFSDISETRWGSFTEDKKCISRDGMELFYQVIGRGKRTMVLANGLGGRLYSWGPLLDHFHNHLKFICWDYRGLFDSDKPSQKASLSINRHADDLCDILKNEEIDQAVIAGWSMGVQVSLEFASNYPGRVESLILINGTHGHTFQTAFQPIFRMPFLHKYLHEAVDLAIANKKVRKMASFVPNFKMGQKLVGQIFKILWRNKDLPQVIENYAEDVFNEYNFPNFLRLVQELDAHSVYHHLREMRHKTLIISGGMDLLTPAYQSREMARKLRNSKHIHYPFASHFVLLERSADIIPQIEKFIWE